MPRWNIDSETKRDLNVFKSEIEDALKLPENSLSQDALVRLFIKHKSKVRDVIVTEESVTDNTKPIRGSVAA